MILVIPMAGRGSRFADKGFKTPKPLIEVNGKPMLYYAFQSVKNLSFRKIIFIALKEHQADFDLRSLIKNEITPDFELILLNDVTEGQLCTVLQAKDYFLDEEGLLIAASDSYVRGNIAADINTIMADGVISVTNLPGDRWSFARTGEDGRVIEVAEKNRISDNASTGIYYFSNAKLFATEAEQLIKDKETTKGEYFVMPLYNRYIRNKKDIRISRADEMWDMGTPEAKEAFEKHLRDHEI